RNNCVSDLCASSSREDSRVVKQARLKPLARNKLHSYIHLEVTGNRVSVVCGGHVVDALHGRPCRQGQQSPAKVVVVSNAAAVLKKRQLRNVSTAPKQESEQMV